MGDSPYGEFLICTSRSTHSRSRKTLPCPRSLASSTGRLLRDGAILPSAMASIRVKADTTLQLAFPFRYGRQPDVGLIGGPNVFTRADWFLHGCLKETLTWLAFTDSSRTVINDKGNE